MTDYEILDAMFASFGLGFTAVVLYLTVLSSFLIVAYFAGAKLTRVQVVIVTGLFVLSAIFATWASIAFLAAARELQLLQVTAPLYSRQIAPHHLILPVELIGILASLKFMWDVRHPKTE